MRPPPHTDIGIALRTLRKRRSLTGRDLANMTGISQGHISELETGRRKLTHALSERIAVAWNITVSQLHEDLDALTSPDSTHPDVAGKKPLGGVNAPPTDEYRDLAIFLVGNMAKPQAWELVRKLSSLAECGSVTAARSARALITILSEIP